MPELPEVETVRRIMRSALQGQTLTEVEIAEDDLVFQSPPSALREVLTGAEVVEVGRRGKYWWLELRDRPFVLGHLGMAGWIRELGQPTARLREHGEAPLDDEEGRPRFLKWQLGSSQGRRVAMTDGRRLARVWLTDHPASDKAILKLGPDIYEAPPTPQALSAQLAKRKAPLKAVLLDQGVFCGIGNYLADEILYQSRLSPHRLGNTITEPETVRLIAVMASVLETAIGAGADSERFPQEWLFHARWGGAKGVEAIDGHPITRETVGGRTTAWVPSLQS